MVPKKVKEVVETEAVPNIGKVMKQYKFAIGKVGRWKEEKGRFDAASITQGDLILAQNIENLRRRIINGLEKEVEPGKVIQREKIMQGRLHNTNKALLESNPAFIEFILAIRAAAINPKLIKDKTVRELLLKNPEVREKWLRRAKELEEAGVAFEL